MRSTIDIDDDLLQKAMKLTKAKTKRELINMSLREIIHAKRRKRLVNRLGNFNLNLTHKELEKMRADE
ncbi:MAG: type II toxin-antitoxin system VapB family antitoxin [Gemmatimonadota bacterium]|nr:MAG: type II toxin-antitoxin system VapB family antitoxin [Gemmatimonadota bacterium]